MRYDYDIKNKNVLDLFYRKLNDRRNYILNSGELQKNTLDLQSWDFTGTNFSEIFDADMLFAYALFNNCNFTDCIFPNLRNVLVLSSNFYNATFCRVSNVVASYNNFESANFIDSVIVESAFIDANFRHATFNYATISDCAFRGADFEYAQMDGAIIGQLLYAKNIITFDFDSRGYKFIAVKHGKELMIKVGCHYYNEREAIAHWSDNLYHTPELGRKYLIAIASARLFLFDEL